MNEDRTVPVSRANLTQAGSRPVRYRLMSVDGYYYGIYPSASDAAAKAALLWPDQEQDETRSGKGWDIGVVT